MSPKEPVRVVVVTEFVPARGMLVSDVPARDVPAREMPVSEVPGSEQHHEGGPADTTSGDTAGAASSELQPTVVLLTLRALRGETCIFDVGFTTDGLRVYAVPEYQPLARTVAGELLMYTAQETRWEMIVQWMLEKVAVVEMGVGKE